MKWNVKWRYCLWTEIKLNCSRFENFAQITSWFFTSMFHAGEGATFGWFSLLASGWRYHYNISSQSCNIWRVFQSAIAPGISIWVHSPGCSETEVPKWGPGSQPGYGGWERSSPQLKSICRHCSQSLIAVTMHESPPDSCPVCFTVGSATCGGLGHRQCLVRLLLLSEFENY